MEICFFFITNSLKFVTVAYSLICKGGSIILIATVTDHVPPDEITVHFSEVQTNSYLKVWTNAVSVTWASGNFLTKHQITSFDLNVHPELDSQAHKRG